MLPKYSTTDKPTKNIHQKHYIWNEDIPLSVALINSNLADISLPIFIDYLLHASSALSYLILKTVLWSKYHHL